jgi:hypothetical protein
MQLVRDPGGQGKADEDYQGEGNSGGSTERRSVLPSEYDSDEPR